MMKRWLTVAVRLQRRTATSGPLWHTTRRWIRLMRCIARRSNLHHTSAFGAASFRAARSRASSEEVDSFAVLMKNIGTQFERFTYDAGHGFFAHNRNPVFNEVSAALSWESAR